MNIDFVLSAHGYGSGSSKDKTPPPPITNFKAEGRNANVLLTWTNPNDTDFVGVRIQRKAGSYPTSKTDGTTVFNGVATTFTDASVVNDTTYFYRAFSYDYDNNFNETTTGQQATATPKAHIIHGFAVNENDTNPETAVTYIEASVGKTPAKMNFGGDVFEDTGGWLNEYPFNAVRPVAIASGTNVITEVMKTDFTKDANGNALTGEYNLMIEVPTIYWNFKRVANGYEVRWSKTKVSDDYKALAHARGSDVRPYLYMSAYPGSLSASKLWSTRNALPSGNSAFNTYRSYGAAHGLGYGVMTYNTYTLIAILFLTMFKTLNSQAAMGSGQTTTGYNTSGHSDTKGMYYAKTDYSNANKSVTKFMGIEDLWGNTGYFLEGIYGENGSTPKIRVDDNTHPGTTAQYPYTISYPLAGTGAGLSYLKKVTGDTCTGFFPLVADNTGTSSTHYADYVVATPTNVNFYIRKNTDQYTVAGQGLFSICQITTNDTYVGARLQYLPPS